MEKLIPAIFLLILLIVIRMILKRWIKQYEERNPIELKINEIRNYHQFIQVYSKTFYTGTKFLIIILVLKIVYEIIKHYS